jgi:Transglutaminase-like superfamily
VDRNQHCRAPVIGVLVCKFTAIDAAHNRFATMLTLHNKRFAGRGCAVATCVFLLAVSGCDTRAPSLSIRSAPDANGSDIPAEIADSASAHEPPDITPKGQPREWWEAIYVYGTKIGWGHTQMLEREEDGRKIVEISNQSHLAVDRSGHRLTIEIATSSVETPGGELLRFRTEMTSGASQTVTTGTVADGQLIVKTTTSGRTNTQSFPWPGGTLGFSGAEQSLSASPLLPGTKRELRALMPATNEIVTIDLAAADRYQSIPLLDHTEDLLCIASTITLPVHAVGERPPVIRSQLWTDRDGQVLKTVVAALDQETFRAAREIALAETGPRRLDLVLDNSVPVTTALADPHSSRQIRYRVYLASDDPAKVFHCGGLQQVTSLDPHTAEITVRRFDWPGAAASGGAPDTSGPTRLLPSENDRAPNNLIQSDDDEVVRLAKSVAPNETDPTKLAVALESYVKELVTLKNFAQAFDTAAEVARHREGDCTEHAVLLAGLARARGIPARVVIGLVYSPATQSFVYHMWDEIWTGQRWMPLDATLGRGGIGAAHLKLTDSNLAGAQAYSCFLPVAEVIGQLKIEVLDVE